MELSFDEEKFCTILQNETKIALKEGINVFSFNMGIGDTAQLLKQLNRNINYIYNNVELGFIPKHTAIKANGFHDFAMPESIAAHTNTMMAIYDAFRDVLSRHTFRYDKLVFMTAIRKHDLAENTYLGYPDNHYHDFERVERDLNEANFFMKFDRYVPRSGMDDYKKANQLIEESRALNTPDGKAFHLCDKLAMIINPLTAYRNYLSECVTYGRKEPVVNPPINFTYAEDSRPTPEEKLILKAIRNNSLPSMPIPAYELYTGDYLEVSKMYRYDDFGFFTNILIAYTLATTGRWYNWRETTYRDMK
ncbi:hypothetical protein J6T21_04450 [Candidatus Saccharibacteria bacterium]|nr:hypothetical protein [Candidatus Saccharibacteria bacterium]